ncbi:MAG: Uma2 family endonuclease [Pyrinomonadaceae bacterium]
MTPNPAPKMTLEEYFEFDKNAEGRFEYFDGEVFELSGVSAEHSRIERILAVKLLPIADAKGCRTYNSSFRVKPKTVSTYRYPDFSLVCGEPIHTLVGGVQCLTNPQLIIEILSDSTERYDRGEKFTEYKSIENFVEYLLIFSTSNHVALFQKHNERFWFMSEYSADEEFHLNTLDIDMAVNEIYSGIEFVAKASGTGIVKEVG